MNAQDREPKSATFPFSWLAGDEARPKQGETAMTIKTNVKAGGITINHNETLAVRSAVKAGGLTIQHNEALAVRSNVQAGGISVQHNETFRR
jgi:hypothetical protein